MLVKFEVGIALTVLELLAFSNQCAPTHRHTERV